MPFVVGLGKTLGCNVFPLEASTKTVGRSLQPARPGPCSAVTRHEAQPQRPHSSRDINDSKEAPGLLCQFDCRCCLGSSSRCRTHYISHQLKRVERLLPQASSPSIFTLGTEHLATWSMAHCGGRIGSWLALACTPSPARAMRLVSSVGYATLVRGRIPTHLGILVAVLRPKFVSSLVSQPVATSPRPTAVLS